jgi:hypothetical protein
MSNKKLAKEDVLAFLDAKFSTLEKTQKNKAKKKDSKKKKRETKEEEKNGGAGGLIE